ncbi:MAG: FAD-dependent oxidoreductase [Chitinophagaceae bacterium]
MAKHLVIIGNGIAGVTCAREVRKLDSSIRITIISSESKHFFSRTALMYVYMGHMKLDHIKPYEDWFWKKNRIDLVHDHVTKVDTTAKLLTLEKTTAIPYDILVLATGSKSNTLNVPGKDLKNVQGLYSLQDLELMEKTTNDIKKAVIVGGGLIGIEMAEMLSSRGVQIKMIIREKLFWNGVLPDEEAAMIGRHLAEHGVKLIPEAELESIHDLNGDGEVNYIITKGGRRFDADFVGIAIGVSANIDFIKGCEIETDRGILVDEKMASSIPNVYAIGDCTQYRNAPEGRKTVEQVWYTGRMHGETLAKTICGNETRYRPGPWFNSAKFLDIEFQTYGIVKPILEENVEHFYWEHPEGKISFRAAFDKRLKTLQGINVFGMRLRHDVLDLWLRDKRDLPYVLARLSQAQFDPEFSVHHEQAILNAYNNQYGTKIIPLSSKATSLI